MLELSIQLLCLGKNCLLSCQFVVIGHIFCCWLGPWLVMYELSFAVKFQNNWYLFAGFFVDFTYSQESVVWCSELQGYVRHSSSLQLCNVVCSQYTTWTQGQRFRHPRKYLKNGELLRIFCFSRCRETKKSQKKIRTFRFFDTGAGFLTVGVSK